MQTKYDYLIVDSGLFGATFAHLYPHTHSLPRKGGRSVMIEYAQAHQAKVDSRFLHKSGEKFGGLGNNDYLCGVISL